MTILRRMFPTLPPPPQRLLVFARVPERGRVKTRLAAEIGDDRALAVYEAMLQDVLDAMGSSTRETEIEICWAPTTAARRETLARAFGDRVLAMQTGANLGDRLSMALSERFFFQRTQKIIAIGVDDPLLDRAMIDHAFSLLDSCEWVLGPAADGGYYLIGCRGPAFDLSVFMDIDWGTDRVLSATIQKIRASGHTLAMLPQRHDVDVAEDLRRLAGADNRVGRLVRALELRR
jgi:rSAM/selenodomain-associated transferase 1